VLSGTVMENAKGNAPASMHTGCQKIAISGFVAMHGRPGSAQQAEHEHPEIQIATYFPRANSRAPIALDALPECFSLIPSGKPHRGTRNEGSEVIVVHLEPTELDQSADELLRKRPSPFRPLDFAVDPIIHSMGSALRREFLLSKIPDRLFVEAVGTVLVGHLLRQQAFRWSERSIKGKLSPQGLRDTLDLIDRELAGELSVATLARNLSIYPWVYINLRASSETLLGGVPINTLSNGELSWRRAFLSRPTSRLQRLRWNWDSRARVISLLCFGNVPVTLRKHIADCAEFADDAPRLPLVGEQIHITHAIVRCSVRWEAK
jgi:hypothetical protein